MKRALVLGLLAAIGSVVMVAAQQPAADAPKVVDVEKINDSLYVLRGENGGGNTAVLIMAKGVAVVDAKNPGWGQPILAKIKELTPKPVTLLINTHTHGDHVSGNVEFPASVDVVVHENTKTNMEKMPIFKEHNNAGMAKRTFKDKMTIGIGRRSNRPVLLRPRTHQRRRLCRLPGASHRPYRRHFCPQGRAADRYR